MHTHMHTHIYTYMCVHIAKCLIRICDHVLYSLRQIHETGISKSVSIVYHQYIIPVYRLKEMQKATNLVEGKSQIGT